MDILIIGNGFDLAHGLKTSYKDFLEYCGINKKCCETNIWIKHFINRQKKLGNNWIDLENEIYKVIKKVNELPIANGMGSITQKSPQVFFIQMNDTDFDFNKMEKYIRKPYSYEKKGENDYECIKQDDNMFNVYINNTKGFINFLYNQLREFTKIFENYLINEVLEKMDNKSQYILSLQAIGVKPNNQNIYVISFNYTDTCERLYKHKFNTYCQLKINPIYVHGKACKSKSCNLILGTYSFDNTNKTNFLNHAISVDFNVFKKHNQRHHYETIEAYQNFISKLTNAKIIKPIFHIIGHSLDETDHIILRHLLLANKNAIINIYYHNEEAQERLINNITKIISEEEVMTKVRFIY